MVKVEVVSNFVCRDLAVGVNALARHQQARAFGELGGRERGVGSFTSFF